MKILFVGLGSIGQRHLQNFKEIYGDLHHIFHLKSSANNLFIENGKAYEVDNLAKKYEINEINEIICLMISIILVIISMILFIISMIIVMI